MMNVPRQILFILFFILFTIEMRGQDGITTNPDSATIISNDIDRFWEAFDLLKSQKSTADSLKTIRTIFIEHASKGLRQYMKAANCYEEKYLETIREKKNDYLSVRKKTQMIRGEKKLLIQYLSRFKQIYPPLKIPVICYTIGIFQVGGTQFEDILFIGCETDAIQNVDIPAQTMHELSHFQQKDQNPNTNLDLAMIEGGAEFISYQVTGKRTLTDTWTYGLVNESGLWKDFDPKMDSAIDSQWFLNKADTAKRRPGSLGYFIGYRICESYLKNQDDKKSALKELIEMENPGKIYLGSLYNPDKN